MLFSRQLLNGSQDFFFNVLILIYFFKYETIETRVCYLPVTNSNWDPCPRIFDTYYFSYSYFTQVHALNSTIFWIFFDIWNKYASEPAILRVWCLKHQIFCKRCLIILKAQAEQYSKQSQMWTSQSSMLIRLMP